MSKPHKVAFYDTNRDIRRIYSYLCRRGRRYSEPSSEKTVHRLPVAPATVKLGTSYSITIHINVERTLFWYILALFCQGGCIHRSTWATGEAILLHFSWHSISVHFIVWIKCLNLFHTLICNFRKTPHWCHALFLCSINGDHTLHSIRKCNSYTYQ